MFLVLLAWDCNTTVFLLPKVVFNKAIIIPVVQHSAARHTTPNQTGNRTFQNGGCGGDRGLQTFSSKHKAILVQATKAPTLSLVWTCETIWEDQRKLLNMKTAKSLRTAAQLQDFIEEHKPNLTRWGKLSRSHLAWSALVQRWIRQKNRNYSVNYSCTRNPTNTISLILTIFARWILVAFAVLVFSDTKSRVINLLLTEFARAVLGEYRPSVFLVRTSPKRLGPYCQDLGPIFSQYSPRTRSIRYMYCPLQHCDFAFIGTFLTHCPAHVPGYGTLRCWRPTSIYRKSKTCYWIPSPHFSSLQSIVLQNVNFQMSGHHSWLECIELTTTLFYCRNKVL